MFEHIVVTGSRNRCSVQGLHWPSFASATRITMTTLLSIFIAHDRVRITKGTLHGFTATVMDIVAPGKLALSVHDLPQGRALVVDDDWVEPCEAIPTKVTG
jgi:hypothetical protein